MKELPLRTWNHMMIWSPQWDFLYWLYGVIILRLAPACYSLALLSNLRQQPPLQLNEAGWHMHQRHGSLLVQIMASRLRGTKPLPESAVTCCQWDPWKQTSVKFQTKYKILFRKCIWRCFLQNVGHFLPACLFLALIFHPSHIASLAVGGSLTSERDSWLIERSWPIALRGKHNHWTFQGTVSNMLTSSQI